MMHVDVFETQDIGGTDFWTVGIGANAGWVSMEEYSDFCAFVTIGATWNAADQLDGLYLEQATSAAGAGAKAMTVAKNLNQTAANAAGESFSLDCAAEDLDVDGGFLYVRCMISEAGNTGQDDVSVTYVRTGGRYLNANESGCTATV
jgi:hypothetical protein